MNNIGKLDQWLIQKTSNSINLKDSHDKIVIGSLAEHIKYINNNPLLTRLISFASSNSTIEIDFKILFDPNLEPILQYVKRLPETPFYASYLVNSELAVKVIDFYTWQPDTVIYRLMILKKLNLTSKK